MNRSLQRALALVPLLVAFGCGEAPPTVSLVLEGRDALMFDPETAEILAYGSGVSCTTLEAEAVTRTDPRCTASDDLEAGTCYLERVVVSYTGGASADAFEVPVGERRILVRGYDWASDVVAVGCATARIRDGETTSVTIVVHDPQ